MQELEGAFVEFGMGADASFMVCLRREQIVVSRDEGEG